MYFKHIFFSILIFFTLVSNSFAYSYDVSTLSNKLFVRGAGATSIETVQFSKHEYATNYRIELHNGGYDGEYEAVEYSTISSAKIWLNGELIFSPQDFNKNVTYLERSIALVDANDLEVELASKSGSAIIINITGTVENSPPSVTSIPILEVNERAIYQYQVVIADIDPDDSHTYALLDSPIGMIIDSNGLIVWSTSDADVGTHIVIVQVLDAVGITDSQEYTLTVANVNEAPEIISTPIINSKAGQLYSYQVIANDIDDDSLHFSFDTAPQSMLIHPSFGLVEWTPTEAEVGEHLVSILVWDGNGGYTSQPFTLVVASANNQQLPPNPEDIAPEISLTEFTSFKNKYSFLYDSATPVQQDINPEVIDAELMAIIKGTVLDKDNNPVSGVKVSILDHEELGWTLSREDGQYDLVVNGGGASIVSFSHSEYFPIQRRLLTSWQEFFYVDDVVMTKADPIVTTITASSSDIQIASGSTMTDADGQRTAVVVFPANTQATMTLPDGTQQALTTLNVRATEYTVGENGPKAMPGTLPPASGYTYAVELSVDEAIQAGASKVEFNQALPVYVDNFLNFPVGEVVPSGWYDAETAKWIPSDNGMIVKILALDSDGKAMLDVEGNDQIATQEYLDLLNITNSELQLIAQTYPIGKSFWRVPVTHFTPFDFNWAINEPDTSDEPPKRSMGKLETEDCEEECGSIVEVQSQILGESVKIAGTDFSLNYRSETVPDSNASRMLNIALTGGTISDDLRAMRLTINFAGRRLVKEFPIAYPNQAYNFAWDGKDIYGNIIKEHVGAKITLEYIYDVVYLSSGLRWSDMVSGDFTLSFGEFGENDNVIGSRRIAELSKKITWSESLLGASDVKNMGGWFFSPQLSYNAPAELLTLGTGANISSRRLGNTIVNVLNSLQGSQYFTDMTTDSKGNLYFLNQYLYKLTKNGDLSRIQIRNENGAILYNLSAITISEDGKVYISGQVYISGELADQIWKLDIDTSTNTAVGRTVVGNGSINLYPDNHGQKATEVGIASISDIVLSSTGELYFSVYEGWITKVDSEGQLSIVSGSSDYQFNGDNIPAKEANLNSPKSLAFNSQGQLLIATSYRVRKINNSGIITTIAGNGEPNRNNIFDIQGQLATESPISVHTIAIDNNDKVYIYAESKIHFIEYGRIADYVGNGMYYNRTMGVGGNPLDVTLERASNNEVTGRLVIGPDNQLFISTIFSIEKVIEHDYVNKLNIQDADSLVTSTDGSLIYQFNSVGKHLATLNAKTFNVMQSFTYNDEGYLISIIDDAGNETQIERINNEISEIISPTGLRTSLQLNADGYISSFVDPQGYEVNADYTEGGLLTHFTDANINTSIMTYDGEGHLLKDENAEGGFWELSRSAIEEDSANGFQVTLTTAEALQKVMAVTTNNLNQRLLTTQNYDGSITSVLTKANGRLEATSIAGTKTSTRFSPDPLFQSMAPYASQIITKLPSGLTSTAKVNKSIILADELDILSATKHTNVVTVNGNESRSVYDLLTNTVTTTSAEGRNTLSTLDERGRVLSTTVDGLATTYYAYTPTGEVSSVSQQSGAMARTSTLDYNEHGYISSITDALGNVTNLTNDLLGRITQKESVLTNDDNQLIDFTYDGNSNIIGLNLPTGDEHLFEFNALDKETVYVPPSIALPNHTTERFYDLDKRLTRIAYPLGDDVTFNYHVTKGQLTSINTPQGDIAMNYQPTTGLLTQIEAANGQQLNYQYDGELLLSEIWANGTVGDVSRQYNNHFLVNSIGVNGDTVAYSYDKDNLVVQAGDLTLERDALNGTLSSTTLANINTSQTLNGFSELMDYQASYSSTNLFNTDYTRDNLGRITSLTETINGQTSTFDYSYDQLGQLIEVKQDSAIIQSYQFDANGNRTLHNGIVATFDAQDRLLTRGTTVYLYDANGALTTITDNGQTQQFSYDLAGNLLQATVNGKTIDYIIDGKNRRVAKKVNGILQQGFLYQDQLNPIAELDKDKNVVSRFIYADKINVPSVMEKGGNTYRIISDHLGSVRLVVDISDGAIAQQLSYDVNGNVLNDTNPGFQPFGFAGGIYDQDTGLVRFGARDYDPITARWTIKDPIRFDGGINLYVYINNDSVNRIDLDGKSPLCLGLAALDIGYMLLGLYDSTAGMTNDENYKENLEKMNKALNEQDCSSNANTLDKTKAFIRANNVATENMSEMGALTSNYAPEAKGNSLGLALNIAAGVACGGVGYKALRFAVTKGIK